MATTTPHTTFYVLARLTPPNTDPRDRRDAALTPLATYSNKTLASQTAARIADDYIDWITTATDTGNYWISEQTYTDGMRYIIYPIEITHYDDSTPS